eukprot:snap_masked-scaffold_5-processed-gene-9.28-mRNA-1 protein AED:1.00 eAED:1.00 QI:0/0/0/0/1/1/2/0/111
MTPGGKIRGALGKLFQRSHEVLYFFKRRDVKGSAELEALRTQEVFFADRPKHGMKPLTVKKWIKWALREKAVLMEVFAKAGGLQKGWLQIETQVDPYGRAGSIYDWLSRLK